MNIDSINNGVVIDHITAGRGMKIYELLSLNDLDATVAIIKNAPSAKMGRKDLIKIDADIEINLDAVAFVDPGATVNIIQQGSAQKRALEIPEKLVNVISCKNPRCISTCEQELDQVFVLADRDKKIYRCAYCETKANA